MKFLITNVLTTTEQLVVEAEDANQALTQYHGSLKTSKTLLTHTREDLRVSLMDAVPEEA